jgi:subtilisin-like proprotein convertase family protein
MNHLALKCVKNWRVSCPTSRFRSGFLAVSLCLVSYALWPATGRAQSFTSSGTITVGSSTASPYPSAITVTGLSGTLTALTLTFTNFSVSNANSLAIVLQAPDGTHNLDLFSATANAFSGSTFTLSDSGTHGLVPLFINQSPIVLSGAYKATDYFPAQDNFPGPGPGTNYTSAGDGTSGSGTGNFLNTFGTIAGANLNGTWKLYIANQDPPLPPSGTIASWTLSFTLTNAPATTTTLDPPSPNPGFTSGANSLVTLTAHVNKADLSGPATNGSVVFHDNTLNQDIATNAVDASGTAIVGYTFTNEGTHTLLATFAGGTGFAPSLPSATATETVVNHSVIIINGEVTTVNNPGHIAVLNGVVASTPYPSLIYVGTNGASSLPGIIQKLTISLNNFSYPVPDDLGFMLVAPNGTAYEFMSFAGGGVAPGVISLTFDDNAGVLLPQHSINAGTFKPSSYDNQVTLPQPYPSPAPQTFDAAAPYGTSTLATEFSGRVPNGIWKLFLANRLLGPAGTLGSWSLNFTINPPDLSISYAQFGNFCQGEVGAQYSLAVNNALGAPTGGDVAATVTNTLPAGLTPTAASGPTWNCVISNQTVICTQTNPTAAGTSYPPITVTVNVASNAPASLTNTATVSGSMDNTPGNNTVNILTTINPMPAATITPLSNPPNLCPNSTGNTAGLSGSVGLTLRVSNAAGCTATNSLDVPILVDTTPPTITCSSNITVTAIGHCPVTVNFNVSASDNCTLSSLVATPASGSAFPVGTNIVTVVATDGSGNTNTCTFKVTVLPGPAPRLAAVLSGTNVVLSWPADAGCYALQSTPALLSPPASNVWTTYAGPLITNGGSIFVTNSAPLAGQFYRLAY